MTVIRLDDASLIFHVRTHGRISLKEYLVQGRFRRHKDRGREVRALEHVNLTINHGSGWGFWAPTAQARAPC